jgi:hypothetical protein
MGANLMSRAGFSGKPFWQDESYDHLVRGEEEFERIEK